jgi:hypothetical protein
VSAMTEEFHENLTHDIRYPDEDWRQKTPRYEWMSMEQWWNDTDRGKLKYWEENIIQRGW